MGHCKDCKHWVNGTDWGTCQRADGRGGRASDPTSLAYAEDVETYSASLFTHADFGCVQFGAKDPACQHEGCDKPATTLACERLDAGGIDGTPHYRSADRYCDDHAWAVARECNPEGVEHCPHCGCAFGIG